MFVTSVGFQKNLIYLHIHKKEKGKGGGGGGGNLTCRYLF